MIMIGRDDNGNPIWKSEEYIKKQEKLNLEKDKQEKAKPSERVAKRTGELKKL